MNANAFPCVGARPDQEIASAVRSALASNVRVRPSRLRATVRMGVVTLEGDVDWEHQRYDAESAVRSVIGVRDVINRIEVHPRIPA
jgi:osmotically-inducible protein OsmY